jgi:hypothetical protein
VGDGIVSKNFGIIINYTPNSTFFNKGWPSELKISIIGKTFYVDYVDYNKTTKMSILNA